jgi:hypothetical protein
LGLQPLSEGIADRRGVEDGMNGKIGKANHARANGLLSLHAVVVLTCHGVRRSQTIRTRDAAAGLFARIPRRD